MQQLTEDERMRFPRATRILMTNVYMADIVTGADSVEDALALKQERNQLLASGGFTLKNGPATAQNVWKTYQLTIVRFHCP